MQAYRNAYGGSMDERLLQQLGIDQRIVQQLIEEEAALAEARRQGITASDAEVRARILALPAFQENGHFIGNAALPADCFRCRTRRSTRASSKKKSAAASSLEKLQGALTDWITVADADVTAEFNRRNEKVKLAVVAFPADKFKDGVAVTDAEVASHFEASKETLPHPREAQDQVRADRSAGHPAAHERHARRTSSATTRTTSSSTRRPSRCAPATSSSRPRAKTMRR